MPENHELFVSIRNFWASTPHWTFDDRVTHLSDETDPNIGQWKLDFDWMIESCLCRSLRLFKENFKVYFVRFKQNQQINDVLIHCVMYKSLIILEFWYMGQGMWPIRIQFTRTCVSREKYVLNEVNNYLW